VLTDDGPLRLEVPCDRDGSFEPLLIPKHERRFDDDKRQHRIRLNGIDAPKSRKRFGNRSKQSISDLPFDRRAEANCAKTDCYGRQVCKVVVGGVDVGLDQIRLGCAAAYRRFTRPPCMTSFASLLRPSGDGTAARLHCAVCRSPCCTDATWSTPCLTPRTCSVFPPVSKLAHSRTTAFAINS